MPRRDLVLHSLRHERFERTAGNTSHVVERFVQHFYENARNGGDRQAVSVADGDGKEVLQRRIRVGRRVAREDRTVFSHFFRQSRERLFKIALHSAVRRRVRRGSVFQFLYGGVSRSHFVRFLRRFHRRVQSVQGVFRFLFGKRFLLGGFFRSEYAL